MRIIYLSNTLLEDDFEILKKDINNLINPSNQNFHYRFLSALSLHTHVEAFSLRPFLKKNESVSLVSKVSPSNENLSFTYLPNKNTLIYKYLKRNSTIYKVLEEEIIKDKRQTIIIVDGLKYVLAKVALKLRRYKHVKVYGIITDNPTLLSNESSLYSWLILKQYEKYDGYFCLSEGLNKLANVNNKLSYLFFGFAEEMPKQARPQKEPYFFTCGALYKRYGIINLIEAFLKLKTNNQLLIAGHGPLIKEIKEYEQKDQRIRYLGLLSRNDILKYEEHATLNINARLFDESLDQYSLPSKVLEYLASGTPLLSTIHTSLMNEYKDEVMWVKDDSEIGLNRALNKFLKSDNKVLKEKALEAKRKVLNENSLKTQGEKIYTFLKDFN